MNYPQLVNAVEAALRPRAAAKDGDVVIARSPEAARGMLLATPPARWKIILVWQGYGEHALAREGMTSHLLATVIHQQEVPLHRPGENLTKPLPSGAAPFSDLVEHVVGWMAGMRFPDGTNADYAGFALAGSDWVESSKGTNAHVINWKVDAAVPPPPLEYWLEFPHLNPPPDIP